jgi:hypothetical protein
LPVADCRKFEDRVLSRPRYAKMPEVFSECCNSTTLPLRKGCVRATATIRPTFVRLREHFV